MIEKGKRVKFHYTLTVGGKVVESSHPGDPIEHIHGKDKIIEGLQKGLEGREAGESCTIEVKPEEGYGESNPEAFVEVETDKIPAEALKLGAALTATNEQGKTVQGIVQDIRPETVVIDFNHPLAGKTLRFDVEILSVTADI